MQSPAPLGVKGPDEQKQASPINDIMSITIRSSQSSRCINTVVVNLIFSKLRGDHPGLSQWLTFAYAKEKKVYTFLKCILLGFEETSK